MDPCRNCGTELPDNARFCLQCGTPVEPRYDTRPAGPAEPPKLDFVQPALAGGMFLGLLSSLPILQLGNCVCCMWVLGGGGIAAYLLSRQRPGITYGDGAYAGVLSGLFGAVVATLVSIPVRIISAQLASQQEAQEAMEKTIRELPGMEGPARDFLMRMASPEVSLFTITATFFLYLILFSLFAMAGGILTIAILQKQSTRTKMGT